MGSEQGMSTRVHSATVPGESLLLTADACCCRTTASACAVCGTPCCPPHQSCATRTLQLSWPSAGMSAATSDASTGSMYAASPCAAPPQAGVNAVASAGRSLAVQRVGGRCVGIPRHNTTGGCSSRIADHSAWCIYTAPASWLPPPRPHLRLVTVIVSPHVHCHDIIVGGKGRHLVAPAVPVWGVGGGERRPCEGPWRERGGGM